MYPGFFERENIKNLPEEWICDEMILPLEEFKSSTYDRKLDENISFGYYDGDLNELWEAVGKVVPDWIKSYNGKHRAYCGFVNGTIASFCLIENKGIHILNGQQYKIGGPGCVGTLSEFRHKGIGLTMVKNVTEILKD